MKSAKKKVRAYFEEKVQETEIPDKDQGSRLLYEILEMCWGVTYYY